MVKSKVKYIQSLSQKKQRDEDGVFIAEGPKIINELLADPAMEVIELFATASWVASSRLLLLDIDSSKIIEIGEEELKRTSFLITPNQVLGLFKQPFTEVPTDFNGKITLMADTLQDPGNMGTIIRCADWFGIDQLICSRESADAYNPKTVQSSMGSIARVRVKYEDLGSVLTANPAVPAYAASLEGKSIYEMERISEGIILVGNESRGISPDILRLIKNRITIPRKGKAESLNAAIAMGIILSHLVK